MARSTSILVHPRRDFPMRRARLVCLVAAMGLFGFLPAASNHVAGGGAAVADEPSWQCLPPSSDVEASEILYQDLLQQALASLDRRRARIEELRSEEEIQTYQTTLREFFLKQLGELPERPPLDAQVVGQLPGSGFRVEKVIFQGQLNHHITANFYLPDGQPPFPAVAISSGHSRPGKAAAYNQQLAMALARNGIAALCYDPIGQGERSQIITSEGRPKHNSTTREHFLIGVGSILLGRNTATFRVWDGMRAIDYLASRPEVDPQRIGFAGCSGGGTVTSYVMALDPRVACAAPACYLTTFRHLLSSIGPQDAEQNIFGQVAFGLDQPDYVLLRAPKPTLISSTTGDFFPIEGSWDNFRQAKRIYGRLGYPEQVDLVEADGDHGIQPANRTAIVRWMRRWLLDRHEPVELDSMPVYDEAELQCTEGGQVLQRSGELSVFQLHRRYEQQLAEKRKKLWATSPRGEMLGRVRQMTGVRPLSEIPELHMEKSGRIERDGYHVDKLVLRSTGGVPLPALVFHPADPKPEAYLYVHGDGKETAVQQGGRIDKLVREGFVVVALDLRGFGETKPAESGDWKSAYLAYLLGKSLVGLRCEDILACARWVAYYETGTPRPVHLVAGGEASLAALHAAALEPTLLTSLELDRPVRSWSSQIGLDEPTIDVSSCVHGALQVYDLPDLMESLGPERVTVVGGVGG